MVKLKNGLVIPHWIGKSDDFWYRSGSFISYQFMVVNAATGAKDVAFDHPALAQALSEAAGGKFSADRLPFDKFTYTDARDAIRVTVGPKTWECQLRPVHCAESKVPEDPEPFKITFYSPVPPLSSPTKGCRFPRIASGRSRPAMATFGCATWQTARSAPSRRMENPTSVTVFGLTSGWPPVFRGNRPY
jgi:hypothetical protein